MKNYQPYHFSKPLLFLKPVIFFIFCLLLRGVAFAQITFDEEVEDPFGIPLPSEPSDLVFHALVDIDNDGDLDNFVSHREFVNPCWQVTAFEYFENQGTAECPEFVLMPEETFGLPTNTAVITFVDIDNDGDQDAFIGDHCFFPTITYHENTGDASQPQFSITPTSNIDVTGWEIGFAMLDFGDLDGDGDFDALINGLRPAEFKYLENIGTPTAFDFTAPVSNPFGLSIPAFNSSEWSKFVDMDCDGDLDILNAHWLTGNHTNWMLGFHENFGTPTEPLFDQGVSTERLILPSAVGDLDGDGDMDILADKFYFRNASATGCVTWPTADYTFTQTGTTVDFINNSLWQETSCNPVAFEWDFGDGMTSTEENPTHTFAQSGAFSVCLTVTDIAGEDQFCEIMVDAKDIQQKQALRLYPNPVSDNLLIQYDGDILHQKTSMEIINALGAVIRRIDIENPNGPTELKLDLGELANGMYSLRLQSGSILYTETFIKN
jgi:hypothetical protein